MVPKRGARTRKGVIINEPTERGTLEEAPVKLGKGKEKLVEEEDICVKDWDDVCDDTVTDIKKKPRSLKLKRSIQEDSDDDDDIRNVSATLCASIDNDRVIEILKGLGLSETALQRCIQLCEHPILPGHYYPQHWLQSERAFSFFLEILKAQNWVGMFFVHTVIFVPEILQFYQSVTVHASGDYLSAVVNGKPFIVSIEEVADMFKITHEGLELSDSNGWPPEVGSLTVLRYFDPSATLDTRIAPSCLDGPHQFMFNCIRRSITPRTHSRGYCSIPDLLVIFYLMTGRSVNLASVMFSYIKEVAAEVQKDVKAVSKGKSKRGAKTKRELPYGMWLTHILWLKKVLPTDGYCVSMKDCMTDGLLGQMHFRITDDKLVGLSGDGYAGVGSSSGSLRGVISQLRALSDSVASLLGTIADDVELIKSSLTPS